MAELYQGSRWIGIPGEWAIGIVILILRRRVTLLNAFGT